MKIHCNYNNDGNCYYPVCWAGCRYKIIKISFFRYIKKELRKIMRCLKWKHLKN